MAIGFFVDKLSQPSPDELKSVLNSAFPLWDRLVQFISDNYQMEAELNFGGQKYGWNFRYRKSGKSLVTLFPQADSFVAQVVLGKEQVERAHQLKLGPKVDEMVINTPQFHDGKWLFIPVTAQIDVEDIEKLLLVKKRPTKQKTIK